MVQIWYCKQKLDVSRYSMVKRWYKRMNAAEKDKRKTANTADRRLNQTKNYTDQKRETERQREHDTLSFSSKTFETSKLTK